MKSRGYLLATASGIAAAAAAAGGAQAADMAVKAPAPAPVQAPPSWTGFYVGVHAGVNFQSVESTYAPGNTSCHGCGEIGGGSQFGFIGGGQIGYNWQFAPTWVLGVEGTISGLTGKGTAPPQFNTTKGNGVEGRIDWLATVRGRLGWLIDPDTLIYGTGGVAWGGVKDSANPNGLGSSSAPFGTKSTSTTRTGWVAGGGIEHMFGGSWSHWTLGVEALFVDLGSFDVTSSSSPGKTSTFHNRAAIGQLKLNYKF